MNRNNNAKEFKINQRLEEAEKKFYSMNHNVLKKKAHNEFK